MIRLIKNTYLVEDVTHVSLGLTEPHGEQFRALDGDEVGLALVSDSLGQQSLTCCQTKYVLSTTITSVFAGY